MRGGGDGPDDLFPPKRFLTQRLVLEKAGIWLRSSEILIPDAAESETGARGRILARAETDEDGRLVRIEFGFRPDWGEDIRGTESGPDDVFPSDRFLTRRLIDGSAGKWLRSSPIAVPAERPEETTEPSEDAANETGEVGVDGGSATAADGATIVVPAGAAAEGAEITARVVPEEELPPLPPGGTERLGTWDFEVEGGLTGEVTLSLPLPADEDETWFLGHYDGEHWYVEPFRVEDGMIMVQTDSLSIFDKIKGIPILGDVVQGGENLGRYFVAGVKTIGEGIWDGITWTVDWAAEELGLKEPIVCENPDDSVNVTNPTGGGLVGIYLKGCAQQTVNGPLLLARNPRHIWFEVRPIAGDAEYATSLDLYKWLSSHDEGTLLAPGAIGDWRPTRDGIVRLNAEMTWTAAGMTVFFDPLKQMIEAALEFALPTSAFTNLVSVLLRSDELTQALAQWNRGNRTAALQTVASVMGSTVMRDALIDLMIAAAQHAGVTIKKAALIKLYAVYKVGEILVKRVQAGVEFFKVLVANDEDRLGTVAFTVPRSVCWGGTFGADGGTVSDRLGHACQSERRSERYARYYRLELDEPATVKIDLTASSLDGYLFLSPGGNRNASPLVRNDDGAGGRNARIEQDLEAGVYTIEATTGGVGRRKTGAFQLAVAQTPLEPIGDGSLIVLDGTSDLYQAHVVGGSLFKRLILNSVVFHGYGFQLDDVRSVELSEFDRWATTDLARLDDDARVWRLFPNGSEGIRRLLDITAEQFEAAGFDWDAVISVNQTEFDEWIEGPPITAAELGLEDAQDDEPDDRPAVGTIRVVEPLVEVPISGGAGAGGGAVFTAVSAGDSHTCGLRETGAVECWGYNGHGRADAPAGRFSAVSAGGNHTCGLRETGAVECWGRNDYGQTDAPTGRFSAVSAGGAHTCGLRETGAVECWGSNVLLVWTEGSGPRTGDHAGQTDAPSGSFSAVSAGEHHTCGLRTSGAVECWGSNLSPDEGQYAGQAVAPGGVFSAVSAGTSETCGLRTSGVVECWGDNDRAPPGGAFSAVSVGGAGGELHTCGLRASGTVECWGYDGSGQADAPGGAFSAVSPGYLHTCGLRTSGAVECWGWNVNGETDAPPVGESSTSPPAPNPIIQYVQVFTGERWITYNCVGRDTNGDWEPDQFLVDAGGNPLPNAAGVNDKCVELGWSSRPLPDDAITAVQASRPPQIDRIRCSPSSPRVGEDVVCTATLNGGAPTFYSWSGGSSSSSSSRYTTSWNSAGTYTINLTVSNDGGSDSASTSVTVRPPDLDPPDISISCPAYAETGRSFSCTVHNRGGAVTSWDWSASGGTAGGRSETYSATFTSFGRHIVQLTASNAGGSDSDSTTVRLVAGPPASQYSRCGSDTIKVYWFNRTNFRKHHVDMTGEEATRILGASWWATIGHLSQPACDSWPTGGPVTAESYR